MRKLNFCLIGSFALLSTFATACTDDTGGDEASETDTGETEEESTDGTSEEEESTEDGSTEESTDGSTEEESTSDETDTADGTETETGEDPVGYCATACLEDADCCPVGALDCPGDTYPNNYFCSEEGICEFGGCANNDECTAGGLLPDMECHAIDDQPTCFEPCANDGDCVLQPGTSCIGEADDGTMYCTVEPEPCEEDPDCGGFGICDVDSGECYCGEDEHCSAEGVDTCVI